MSGREMSVRWRATGFAACVRRTHAAKRKPEGEYPDHKHCRVARGSRPRAPTDPDVNLSVYPARAVQGVRSCMTAPSARTGCDADRVEQRGDLGDLGGVCRDPELRDDHGVVVAQRGEQLNVETGGHAGTGVTDGLASGARAIPSCSSSRVFGQVQITRSRTAASVVSVSRRWVSRAGGTGCRAPGAGGRPPLRAGLAGVPRPGQRPAGNHVPRTTMPWSEPSAPQRGDGVYLLSVYA